jgi:hypothetical protein
MIRLTLKQQEMLDQVRDSVGKFPASSKRTYVTDVGEGDGVRRRTMYCLAEKGLIEIVHFHEVLDDRAMVDLLPAGERDEVVVRLTRAEHTNLLQYLCDAEQVEELLHLRERLEKAK